MHFVLEKTNLMIKYLILFFITSSQLLVAQDFVIKLDHLEASEDFEDLNLLDAYFQDKRLVGLGESTHGTHEFFEMRHRLIRYLVENHGFNTIFMEADFANSLKINEYINGAGGNAEDAVSNLALWPWITEEFVGLVEWLKKYNESNSQSKVEFVGVDIQKLDETVKRLEGLLARYDLPGRQGDIIDATSFFKLSDMEVLELRAIEVPRYSGVDVSTFLKEDEYEYKWLLRHLEQILSEKLEKKSMQGTYRDKMMAENILEHLSENDGVKGMFWAHNGHVANLFNKKKDKGAAGGFLKKSMGDQYFILGQEFDRGRFNAVTKPEEYSKDYSDWELKEVTVGESPEGSIAAHYRSVNHPILFIPFNQLPEDQTAYMNFIGAVYWTNKKGEASEYLRRNNHGRDAFDAVILFKESTPTELIGRE